VDTTNQEYIIITGTKPSSTYRRHARIYIYRVSCLVAVSTNEEFTFTQLSTTEVMTEEVVESSPLSDGDIYKGLINKLASSLKRAHPNAILRTVRQDWYKEGTTVNFQLFGKQEGGNAS